MYAFLSVPTFLVLFFFSQLPISALASLVSLFLLAFRSPNLWPCISLNWYVTQGNWLLKELKELKDMSRPSSPTRETAGERNRRQRASATDYAHLHSSNPTADGGAAAAAAAASGSGGDAGGGGDGPAGGGAGRSSKRFRGACEFVCRMRKPIRVAFGSIVFLRSGLACSSRLAVFWVE